MQPVLAAEQAQPRKSAPEPQAEDHRAAPRQTPSAAAAPAQDEQDIGEWAKDFFGEN
jgi:predicted cobalt transporter CbtA